MAMLSHRLRRVLVALPSCFQRTFTTSRASHFPSVSSLLPRPVMKQSTEFGRSPARLFSTTQYQYDPYTGEDSFTPDNEGCDFNHWLITMGFPKENPPSREEMISIFEQTCAKGLGISLEEAKKKIYAICTTSYQGFQARMTIGEVEKFRELPGVQYIIPDSYVDVENKVYGGDKYENGVITPGPIPVPTKEGFDSLEKESASDQEQAQISQTPPDPQRSFKVNQGTLAPIQGQDRGQVPTSRQWQGQRNQMPSFRWSFSRDQRTPTLGQRQGQGNQIPSFQGSFKQGQGTPSVGQVQGQESQIPSHKMGYSQGQGTQTPPYQGLPSNDGQGALANYNQGSPQGNFVQGTQKNYNDMGRGNYIPQSGGNYGFAKGAGNPGFGHGQGQGGQLMSPYQATYNQGQGTPIPGQGQGGHIPSYHMGYSQGLGAPVPPYQGLYNQGIPNNYGQWVFAYYNQGPPHGNFLQGPLQNYNQGGQWNFTPQDSGHYCPPQFGQMSQGHAQGQGNQMPQYQFGYNQGQGVPFLGQWQCQGCGMISYHGIYNQGQGTPNPGQWQGQGCTMPSYQASYSHSQGASIPPHQGNYNHGKSSSWGQGTSANYNQTGQGSYNLQSGGNYGPPTRGSAKNPGHGQNQTFQQVDQRTVASDWSNNNYPTDLTDTCKVPH